MASKTNEQALEQTIQKALTGTTIEELLLNNTIAEPEVSYGIKKEFYVGLANNFNAQYAIDQTHFWHFLENSQSTELEKLQRSANWKMRILERYDRMVKKYGLLQVLKKNLEIDDASFTLFYLPPLASSSNTVKENFAKNEFSITRQVRYNTQNTREEIDMVVFINGIPIATLELKNPWTGQTAKINGIKQYCNRDEKQPLLNFGRCLVHFVVDTDEVYMTTKLVGNKTFFLPFNKGNANGKGNPINPFGHKTSYLWDEVLTKKSLANIIQHFVRFDGKAKDALNKKTLFFPRYHQLNVVRKIIADASKKGVGQTYLIQHSAGSGKSHSITWAAFQLIETHPESTKTKGAKAIDKPLFDSVIVVTDRRLLDKQIRQNIKSFSEVKNIVAPALSSQDLKESLEKGKKIIITTIQKFPFIVDGISDLSNKNFAVIIDEAHSSQSGIAAGKMNQAMGSKEEKIEDIQDYLLKMIKERKMKNNASYLAFTATPKPQTLERFGVKQQDGTSKPFHLYSMKQAIEEGFILDVVANYTTYKSYYEIQKSIEDNPLFDTKKAQKRLKNYVEQEKRTIDTKAEIIAEHFINKIVNTKKLKGKAKAMVITQGIIPAIRYFKAINKILDKKGNPFKIIVAFSGKKTVDGIEVSESDLNGFAEKDTREKFDTNEYRVLVVADKYLTGFDQPKLCAMYVDKKLQGVLAVQALSRLNRASSKLGKKAEDVFVLDFFNKIEDIKLSFDPFYTATTLSKATDINVLHELKGSLDEIGVYENYEIEDFITKYFSNADAQELSPIIDFAANRFNQTLELEDEEKADFKIKAKQFVKIYGQMASIMQFEKIEWEKLFWFLKFLIPKLIVKTRDDELIDELLESVDLSTYGLERTKLNEALELDETESELDPQNSNPRGVHGGKEEKELLDEIIEEFNNRYFSGWDQTPEEGKVKHVMFAKNITNHPDYKSKVADNKDKQNSDLALKKIIDELMLKRRKLNMEEYKRYIKDEAYNQGMFDLMKTMIKNENMNSYL